MINSTTKDKNYIPQTDVPRPNISYLSKAKKKFPRVALTGLHMEASSWQP